ncbi:MATE family efflux transporter [Halomonas denitrificans]|uniref:MATE family efflux transporter n=1 Tax=Halomonas denitrificans TaxID=370769 RepID=UPI0028F6E00F|nr:MATE family efflux transporter [Halomonas denitrificans]
MRPFPTGLGATSRRESWPLIRLALPICGAQLAQAGMSVVDIMMTGRQSATDLAAVSVGASLWMPLMLFMTGTLMGLTPIVAQLMGGGRQGGIRANVHQAMWVGLGLGLVSALLLNLAVAPVFHWMAVPPAVAERAADYVGAVAYGMPAVAIFLALRAFSDGMNHTRPALWISLIGLAVNIPSNYVLIYGGEGLVQLLGPATPDWLATLPALGAHGCGIATAIAMWVMTLAMVRYTQKSRAYGSVELWRQPSRPDLKSMAELLYVGVPIGVAIFVEVTLFTLIALFVASLGEIVVAAHQVALNFTSLLFMLPLSLGMALTVRVGNALGSGDARLARLVAWNGILIALLVALFNSAVLWLSADLVVGLYTHNTQVQALTLSLVGLAMLYQVSDSLQVALAGALRGYKDTRVIMFITLLAYWLVGLGGGHLLGRYGLGTWLPPLGVHGYWIGLIAGLTVAALLLGERFRVKARQVARANIDIAP